MCIAKLFKFRNIKTCHVIIFNYTNKKALERETAMKSENKDIKPKAFGRPALSETQKAHTLAVRLAGKLSELESEFKHDLGLHNKTERESVRGKEVIEISERRLKLANSIDLLNDDIRSMTESGASEASIEQKKDQKNQLIQEMDDLPKLGYTYAEWDAADASVKAKTPGRPKLTIEFSLNRARSEFRCQLAILNRHEKEDGVELSTYASLKKAYKEKKSIAGQKVLPGRPKHDHLGLLQRDLAKVNKQINHIISGKAEAEQKLKLAQSSFRESGKKHGRPLMNLKERLAELFLEQEKLKKSIYTELMKRSHAEGHEETGLDVAPATMNTQAVASPVAQTMESAATAAVASQDNQEEDEHARFLRIREESRKRRQEAMAAAQAQRNEELKEIAQSVPEQSKNQNDEESDFNELVSSLGFDENDLMQSKIAS